MLFNGPDNSQISPSLVLVGISTPSNTVHGLLGPKLHLDRFIRFAELTNVINKE